jgi:hypothetical protein
MKAKELWLMSALIAASQVSCMNMFDSMARGIPQLNNIHHRSQAKQRKLNRIRWSN